MVEKVKQRWVKLSFRHQILVLLEIAVFISFLFSPELVRFGLLVGNSYLMFRLGKMDKEQIVF